MIQRTIGYLDVLQHPKAAILSYVIVACLANIIIMRVAHASTSNQIPPVTDPCVFRDVTDNTLQVEIYDNVGTVTYRESDLQANSVTVERAATASEIALYDTQCQPSDVSLSNLKGNISGESAANWVATRTIELQACEDDMSAGQSIDFASLGANGQSQVIHRVEECVASDSRAERIQIQRLYDLLVAQGILK